MRPSTPGLGPVRSATLHAALPELGVLHQRDIAPLVGVAPLHDARGQRAGAGLAAAGARRSAQSDRWRLTATRGHPVLTAFAHRVLARGQAQTAAMPAAMRQCLTLLHAMVHTRTPWHARGNPGPRPAPSR